MTKTFDYDAIRYYLVGEGGDDWELRNEVIDEYISTLGLTGEMTEDEIADFIYNSNLGVMPI